MSLRFWIVCAVSKIWKKWKMMSLWCANHLKQFPLYCFAYCIDILAKTRFKTNFIVENVSPFFLFSENHRAKLLNSRTYFRLSLTHLQNFIRTQELGSSDNRVAAFNWLHGVYWIATLKMADHCCHALLVLCKGSGLMMSTYFPRGGGNSCLDLFWEINFVTLLLCFPRGSCKLFLKSSTFFATFNVVAR